MNTYTVHFVVIREVQVKANDELQAEREAFAKLDARMRDCVVGCRVLSDDDGDGALSDNPIEAMAFVRKMDAIDRDWVSP